MLFNSAEFLLFLPLVFAAYWAMNGRAPLRAQNLLLLAASYFFYGWWDARFLALIAFSTLVDYAVGLQIAKANARDIPQDADPKARSRSAKRWLAVSLAVNLGLLGYFKYANFFIESWIDAWAAAGVTMHASTLQIILPVGISFYTFQTLSYSIDIYRRQLEPTKDLIAFGAFVSFFPQLVAGPIERASKLLPQIEQRRKFDHAEAVSGLRLILWGLFKKVVVADTCALYVDEIFSNYETMSGPTLILGAAYFAFQIYGDFSGYSDIAIGTARLFGIRLMTNFKAPFFSQDMAEFRRRWYISLYTWFRDYVYIPLGGSKVKTPRRVAHVLLIFLVSGLWHGADWSFIAWSMVNAVLVMPLVIWPPARTRHKPEDAPLIPSPISISRMVLTFVLFCIPLVYFRAHDIGLGTRYLLGTVTHSYGNLLADLMPTEAMMWIAALLLGDRVLAEHPRGQTMGPGAQPVAAALERLRHGALVDVHEIRQPSGLHLFPILMSRQMISTLRRLVAFSAFAWGFGQVMLWASWALGASGFSGLAARLTHPHNTHGHLQRRTEEWKEWMTEGRQPDALYFGSSLVMNGVVPGLVDSLRRADSEVALSFSWASQGQNLFHIPHLLRAALAEVSPETVYIALSPSAWGYASGAPLSSRLRKWRRNGGWRWFGW